MLTNGYTRNLKGPVIPSCGSVCIRILFLLALIYRFEWLHQSKDFALIIKRHFEAEVGESFDERFETSVNKGKATIGRVSFFNIIEGNLRNVSAASTDVKLGGDSSKESYSHG